MIVIIINVVVVIDIIVIIIDINVVIIDIVIIDIIIVIINIITVIINNSSLDLPSKDPIKKISYSKRSTESGKLLNFYCVKFFNDLNDLSFSKTGSKTNLGILSGCQG
jgi:hypothetical protein